ncbi:MAG: TatD family hydrolase [Bacteroidota bacterium]
MQPYLNIHTHSRDFQQEKPALCNIFVQDYPEYDFHNHGLYSAGLHPWHIPEGDFDESLIAIAASAAQDERILAIGECGLDRAVSTPLTLQMQYLLPQLSIAEESSKPVILHCVRTVPEIISIRKKNRFSMPYILHGFTGNIQTAEQLIKHGIYLSFGKFLFRDESPVRDVFRTVDKNMIFLESDDTGIPIEDVYGMASSLASVPVEELKSIVWNNFHSVFNR